MPKLKEKYTKEVLPQLKKKFNLKSTLAVPRIDKVVVNIGIGRFQGDKEKQQEIANDLALITGQRPSFRQAKKAISAFKIREGMVVGAAVTLRGQKMYDFIDRLVNIALPRGRDFRGIPQKKIDQNGNLSIGIKEQIIFPEISAENARNIFGLEVCVVTTATSREEALELFKLMGFPIKTGETK